MLATKGTRQVHTITLDEHKHLSILSCINAAGGGLLNFHIFKGKQMRKKYIHKCETSASMAMQPKTWMMSFLFIM